MTNDPTSAAYEALKQSILKNGKISKSSVTYSQKIYSNDTAGPVETRSQPVVEIGLDDLMEIIEQAIAEAYEQGKNAGHAAQHAKDFDELAEAEAYQVKALAEAETRGRLDAQRTQVEFMAALLREYGGKIEISSKSVLDANPKDTVEVYDDPSGKRIYRLYTKQANADAANGRDGEDK